MCFEWFSKLMNNEEPDLDPNIIQPFFERKILNFDPTLLTECGLEYVKWQHLQTPHGLNLKSRHVCASNDLIYSRCFERFFKFVNIKQAKLVVNKRDEISMDDVS